MLIHRPRGNNFARSIGLSDARNPLQGNPRAVRELDYPIVPRPLTAAHDTVMGSVVPSSSIDDRPAIFERCFTRLNFRLNDWADGRRCPQHQQKCIHVGELDDSADRQVLVRSVGSVNMDLLQNF